MESKMWETLGIDPSYLLILLFILIIILIICLASLDKKYKKLKQNYDIFMSGQEGKSLEESLLLKVQEMNELKKKGDKLQEELKNIKEKLEGSYQKMGLVQYDAFREMGGKLSFALTLLNENDDGWMLNSMQSQEGCYLYIKEIKNGESELELTREETESLEKAVFQDEEEVNKYEDEKREETKC